ncbi:hypothetical protein NG653_04530 [Robiginitalea sp. 2V75]|uniref:Uncharacterized protein n=1 Tax=Robiginitalea marina TaxID=2954105 RepID=A0ABT1AWW5_9FLAO|nr:hypothetical protein [Robiginitalea marina]
MESLLTCLAKGFCYQAEFKSKPVEISFGLRETTDSPQRVEIMATTPPDFDLVRLARPGNELNEVETGTFSFKEASVHIDAIDQIPPTFGRSSIRDGSRRATVFSNVCCSHDYPCGNNDWLHHCETRTQFIVLLKALKRNKTRISRQT